MELYRPRIIDRILREELEAMGAVLLEGAKACGKTSSAEQAANSVIYMDDPVKRNQYLQMVDTDISFILDGASPRLIDEWQIATKIWDAVRFEVDHRGKDGQFILTGSAVPPPKEKMEMKHSGAGRISWLTMRPMTLWESSDSTGDVSLGNLFLNSDMTVRGVNGLKLSDIAFLSCRGGWPRAVDKGFSKSALRQAVNYFEAIVRTDISRVDNVERDEERTRRIMRSYARHQGTQSSASTILMDIRDNDSAEISDKTVYSYINALKSIFVIEDMPAWSPNLRSKSAIRTLDTRYYVDPSIACAALGIGPEDLINDLNTFGFIFECLCVRDLRVYAQSLDGKVYHFRDKTGLECDAVVHLRNGSYGLIEIKLGGDRLINEGAANLMELRNRIDTTKMKAPSFEMVLTAVGDYAYRRTDGVLVVPIGCLKD
ncbi:MAG: ATP-binding protein [Bacteroides sp.]|nr:ATP-binding protein [Bacteroides sp.]